MFICGYMAQGLNACGRGGEVFSPEAGLFLCKYHSGRVKANARCVSGRAEVEAREADPSLPHSRGQTYAVFLPNGLVKVGAAGVRMEGAIHEALLQRWKNLDKAFGGEVVVASVREGGETRESMLHYRLRADRLVAYDGEMFRPAPAVVEAVCDGAMTPEGAEAVRRYRAWRGRRLASKV